MLKALYYIHKVVKIIHRDIKPDNIMVNHYGEAVLIDFGVSAIIENDDTIICKITKFYKFKGVDADTSNKKKIFLKNAFHTYNSIIFQKIHNIGIL
jgi:serine/threonine protein kinase